MANITLQEMYDKWEKAAQGIGNPSDAEAATGDGSTIGILKAIRSFVGGALVNLGQAIGSKAQLVAGSDGTNARALRTTSDGTALVQVTGSLVKQTLASPVTVDPGMTVVIMNFDADGFRELWFSGNISIVQPNDRKIIMEFSSNASFSGSNNFRYVSDVTVTSEISQGSFWTPSKCLVYERYGRIKCANNHASSVLNFRGLTLFLSK